MASSVRQVSDRPSGPRLTEAMISIGMRFVGAVPAAEANIEDTLYFAAVEGFGEDDGRLRILLVAWLEQHAERINADRLIRLVAAEPQARVRAFWRAFAEWNGRDRRFRRLVGLYDGPRVDYFRSGMDFPLQRYGEDSRFAATILRVPGNALRSRPDDIDTPQELAARHRAYRWRVLVGPGYRADMLAELEQEASVGVRELARRTYGSVATAWQVKKDFALWSSARAGQL